MPGKVWEWLVFQSTPSAWRETVFLAVPSPSPATFQSTPSAWRETSGTFTPRTDSLNFNPLPPHGGRHTVLLSINNSTNFNPLPPHGGRLQVLNFFQGAKRFQSTPSAWRETVKAGKLQKPQRFQSTPSAWRETAKLHRKAFFISPILVQSCKKGCKRLHSAPEKMVFFEKREKNLVRNLQHLSVRL